MIFHWRNLKKYSILLVIGAASTQLFQNCGQLSTFEADSAGDLSLGSLSGLNHPSTVELAAPVQKIVTVNRNAVAALIRDIFTSTVTPVPNLEGLIQQWIGRRSSQFGGACNIYDSNSGTDCGDSSNANLAINQDDNTLRESFHVQFCENILAYDQGVSAVLEKITHPAATPDATAIGQVYQLFYRAEYPDPLVTSSLIDLDHSLATQGETPINRWRAVILQVCSSTGWELL
jgi:hypothetical protein